MLARSRLLDQWSITLLLLLPLSLAQDLSKLAFTSMLGLAFTVYVVLLVLQDSWWSSPSEWSSEVVLNRWGPGVFEAIALYTHAFVAHYNAPKLFAELDRPTYLRWSAVVGSAYAMAFFVYSAFAVAAYRRFESAVEGNVLRNYGPQVSVLVAWLGMGFSIAFTYPIVFNSAREACVNLMMPISQRVLSSPRLQDLLQRAPSLRRRFGHKGRSMSLVNVLGEKQQDQKLTFSQNVAITCSIVFLTGAVASFCTDVGLVNALAGSLMGCACAFFFPALLFFRTVLAQLRGASRQGLAEPLLPGEVQAPSPSR